MKTEEVQWFYQTIRCHFPENDLQSKVSATSQASWVSRLYLLKLKARGLHQHPLCACQVQLRYLDVTVQEKLRSSWPGPFMKVEVVVISHSFAFRASRHLKFSYKSVLPCTAFPATLVSMLELSPPLPSLLLLCVGGLSRLNTRAITAFCKRPDREHGCSRMWSNSVLQLASQRTRCLSLMKTAGSRRQVSSRYLCRVAQETYKYICWANCREFSYFSMLQMELPPRFEASD
jgi:hypothetical protein